LSAPDSAPGTVTNTVTGAATSSLGAPGEILREARERAGLSQDDIAGKLKLAPRQIAAIETGDWDSLPERTFTRGFMRSYARIVGLDPAVVGLDRSPSQPNTGGELKPTPTPIGEIAMEVERNSRSSAARWAVPLLLIAVLAAGVVYFKWGELLGLGGWGAAKSATSLSANDAAKSSSNKPTATLLPPEAAAPLLSPSTSSGSVITAPAASPDVAANAAATTPSPAVGATATATPAAPAALLAAVAGEKRITITFRGKSWTEVRSRGDVIYSEASLPGTREFNGAMPLSFIVGNASNVSLSIDGKPYDMNSITRNDVARFRIE